MNAGWVFLWSSALALTDREVYSLLESKQPLTARREAEVLLEADPSSIVGHAVVGTVLWESDGEHARALVHLRQARDGIERVVVPSEGLLSEVHSDVLWTLQEVAGEMETYDEQLALMDALKQITSSSKPLATLSPPFRTP